MGSSTGFDKQDKWRRKALLAAMGDQEQVMRKDWGKEFDALLKYLSLACFPDQGRDRLQAALVARPVARTMLITGERCTGERADGSDSPIIKGVTEAMTMLAPYVTDLPGFARHGREPGAFSIVFSGGQMLTRSMGELPGSELAEQFNIHTGRIYQKYVQSENLSLNTGDQGNILGSLMLGRDVERVILVHVVDHLARFAATLMEGWRVCRDGRAAAVSELWEQGVLSPDHVLHAMRSFPELHLLPVGSLDDVDPRRARGGMSRAREAFGPMQSDEECLVPGKRLGCEYGLPRYGRECLRTYLGMTMGYACRALTPTAMLDILSRDLPPQD